MVAAAPGFNVRCCLFAETIVPHNIAFTLTSSGGMVVLWLCHRRVEYDAVATNLSLTQLFFLQDAQKSLRVEAAENSGGARAVAAIRKHPKL